MATLTLPASGQVTLRKDVLQHLGIQAGQKIQLEEIQAAAADGWAGKK